VKQLIASAGAAPLAVWGHVHAEGGVLSFAASPDCAWLFTLEPTHMGSDAGQLLKTWLADAGRPKLAHDAKALDRALWKLGWSFQGVCADTMVAAHLLNPARSGDDLREVVAEHLDDMLPKIAQEAEVAVETAATCAAAIVRLHKALERKLQDAGLTTLYRTLEIPLIRILARMEQAGIAVDLPFLASLRQSLDQQLAQLVQEIHAEAGGPFNVNSPKQLAEVLFTRLKLPVTKRTKTGPSTDSDVLQRLAAQHPLPRKLIQHRELSKLVSTYIDALPKLADPATSRVHTSFNQTATATGRLSSSNPNLQNIPIRTPLGRSLRKAFIAPGQDSVLLAADYSQVELRILAHMSGDEQLRQAFREGHDIHRYTASLIYGVPESEVQPAQRSSMKAVNFGVLYGMSAHGLSRELSISREEAEAFIAAYFSRYPQVRAYLDSQIEHAKKTGYVQTLLGRRRYIPEVRSPEGVIRQLGERMAINAPIQGSAADLIKQAMVRIDARLASQRLRSRLVLQVHDELVFEAPKAELGQLAQLVRSEMEHAMPLDVPLTVTLKSGANWLEMSEVVAAT
jgi:DNA polymerase-1